MKLYSYIEAQLTSGAWTDISNDMLANPGPRVSYGIKGTSPLDLCAQPGILTFALRNFKNAADDIELYSLTSPPSITPTIPGSGAEKIVDGGFEGGLVAWSLQGDTIADETTLVHSGGHAMRITTAGASWLPRAYEIISLTPGQTCTVSFWTRGDGTNAGRWSVENTAGGAIIPYTSTGVPGTTYQEVATTFVVPAGVTSAFFFLICTDVAGTAYFDDVSVTGPFGFGSLQTGAVNVSVSAGLTIPANLQGGVVLALDSATSPANFDVIYYDRFLGKVIVDEYVADALTNLLSETVTYVAAATLKAEKVGTTLTVTYNGAVVGSPVTVTEGGYTLCGLFATDASVTFANLIITEINAHKLGYYTPGHASCRAGWDEGVLVRWRLAFGPLYDTGTYGDGIGDGESYVKFIGRVRKIQPTAGQFRDRRVSVEARDWLDVAGKVRTQQVPALSNMRADEALPYLIDPVVDQPIERDFDRGFYVFPQVLDVGKDESTTILAQLAKFDQSEMGPTFIQGSQESRHGGILRFGNRHSRIPQVNILDGEGATGSTLTTNASGLFSKWTLAEPPITASGLMTRTTSTCTGFFFAQDDPFMPRNYLTVYETAGSIYVGKVLSGSHSVVMGPCAISYAAGCPLAVTLDKTGASLFAAVRYGGSAVGGVQSISDAGIVSNLVHGIISTCSDSSMLGFSIDEMNNYSASLNETMTEMSIDYSSDEIWNKVKVQVYPRRIDTAACTVITALEKPLMLMPLETKVITLNYRDPASQATRIAAQDFDVLTVDRDYQFGSGDGPGSNDMNDLLTITSRNGANSAEFTLTNTATTRQGFVTRIGLRARGIYLYDPVIAVVEDGESIATRGEIERTVDVPYQTSQIWGKAAADFLINLRGNPTKIVSGLRFCANQSDALMRAALACEMSGRVRLDEPVTAIAGSYNINSADLELMPNNILWCSWGLVPAEMDNYFRPGLPGSCEVGVSACVFGI